MPEAVTTLLDALALLAAATGVGLLAAAAVYTAITGVSHPAWWATAAGTTVAGLALGAGSWATGRYADPP